jgi:hypothetical protein
MPGMRCRNGGAARRRGETAGETDGVAGDADEGDWTLGEAPDEAPSQPAVVIITAVAAAASATRPVVARDITRARLDAAA